MGEESAVKEVERFLNVKAAHQAAANGEEFDAEANPIKYQACKANIYVDRIPLLPRTRDYCSQDLPPGGTRKNADRFQKYLKQHEESEFDIQDADVKILADAMTF